MERPSSSFCKSKSSSDKSVNCGSQKMMQGFGGIGILEKEVIYGNAVEVRRKSDRVMATVLTLGIEAM